MTGTKTNGPPTTKVDTLRTLLTVQPVSKLDPVVLKKCTDAGLAKVVGKYALMTAKGLKYCLELDLI